MCAAFAPQRDYIAAMKRQRRTPGRATATPPSPASATTAEPTEPVGCTPNSCGPERVPPQWAWHYRTLQHLRDRLLKAHSEHSVEAVEPAEMRGVDVADTAQEQLDRDVLWAELGAEDDKLFEIDCALQRIREGTYGFCEETGRPIPAERLRALPWARYCRTVAEARERNGLPGPKRIP